MEEEEEAVPATAAGGSQVSCALAASIFGHKSCVHGRALHQSATGCTVQHTTRLTGLSQRCESLQWTAEPC